MALKNSSSRARANAAPNPPGLQIVRVRGKSEPELAQLIAQRRAHVDDPHEWGKISESGTHWSSTTTQRMKILRQAEHPSEAETLRVRVGQLESMLASAIDTIRSLHQPRVPVQSVSVIKDVLTALEAKPDAIPENVDIPQSVFDALLADE